MPTIQNIFPHNTKEEVKLKSDEIRSLVRLKYPDTTFSIRINYHNSSVRITWVGKPKKWDVYHFIHSIQTT